MGLALTYVGAQDVPARSGKEPAGAIGGRRGQYGDGRGHFDSATAVCAHNAVEDVFQVPIDKGEEEDDAQVEDEDAKVAKVLPFLGEPLAPVCRLFSWHRQRGSRLIVVVASLFRCHREEVGWGRRLSFR